MNIPFILDPMQEAFKTQIKDRWLNGNTFSLYENPTPGEIREILVDAKEKYGDVHPRAIRMLIEEDGKVYAWYYRDMWHSDVADQLGIDLDNTIPIVAIIEDGGINIVQIQFSENVYSSIPFKKYVHGGKLNKRQLEGFLLNIPSITRLLSQDFYFDYTDVGM